MFCPCFCQFLLSRPGVWGYFNECNNSWGEDIWSGCRACLKGLLKLLRYWIFMQPSVNTMLAGLLLHWHALSYAVALVSNHDIWMLSKNIQMLCCWIRQNHSVMFPISVQFVSGNSRLLFWMWQEAYLDATGRIQNTFWIYRVITGEVWHFIWGALIQSMSRLLYLKCEAFLLLFRLQCILLQVRT